ncbi:hypothetical protein IQ07DRAFT_662266 [Pyrenochaeta sp. DS3sAY3a]|nr:hypothetical protein IQ07DRAFT_662266 [Pyrenochaeta sp. DS3sAY3a]
MIGYRASRPKLRVTGQQIRLRRCQQQSDDWSQGRCSQIAFGLEAETQRSISFGVLSFLSDIRPGYSSCGAILIAIESHFIVISFTISPLEETVIISMVFSWMTFTSNTTSTAPHAPAHQESKVGGEKCIEVVTADRDAVIDVNASPAIPITRRLSHSSTANRSIRSTTSTYSIQSDLSTSEHFRRIRPGVIVTKTFDEEGVSSIGDVYISDERRTGVLGEKEQKWEIQTDTHESAKSKEQKG